MKRTLPLIIVAIALASCTSVPKQAGGTLKYSSRGAGGRTNQVEVKQGENPQAATTHSSTYHKTREFTLPKGSIIAAPTTVTEQVLPMPAVTQRVDARNDKPPTPPPNADNWLVQSAMAMKLAGDMKVTETETETHDTSLGASQESGFAKALALRERFAAARPILWVGLAVFVLVGGALAYFGWWTKAIIAWIIGAALVATSVLLPQINPLVLIGVAVAIMIVVSYIVLHAYNAGKADTDGNGVNDFIDKVRKVTGNASDSLPKT